MTLLAQSAEKAPPTIYAVEWSDAAQSFRVVEFVASIRSNFQAWYERRSTDFRVVALFHGEATAREFAAILPDLRPEVKEGSQHGHN